MSDRLSAQSIEILRIMTLDVDSRPEPTKQMVRRAERLADGGYIECGIHPWYGWLTDKGKAALASPA